MFRCRFLTVRPQRSCGHAACLAFGLCRGAPCTVRRGALGLAVGRRPARRGPCPCTCAATDTLVHRCAGICKVINTCDEKTKIQVKYTCRYGDHRPAHARRPGAGRRREGRRARPPSTPHTTPPVSGSAPTLRPRMPPAARRPGLNDAQHAAMTLHNTTFCAIHNCSTMHTHAHIMRDTRDT